MSTDSWHPWLITVSMSCPFSSIELYYTFVYTFKFTSRNSWSLVMTGGTYCVSFWLFLFTALGTDFSVCNRSISNWHEWLRPVLTHAVNHFLNHARVTSLLPSKLGRDIRNHNHEPSWDHWSVSHFDIAFDFSFVFISQTVSFNICLCVHRMTTLCLCSPSILHHICAIFSLLFLCRVSIEHKQHLTMNMTQLF